MRTIISISCLIIILFSSCKKEPEACLSVSNNTPWVGEPVTFTNCSKNYNQSLLNFGDDAPPLTIKGNASHTYYFSKPYTAELFVYNSDNKDVLEDQANQIIVPQEPKQNEINGKWLNYKLSGYDNVFFTENGNVFSGEIKFDSTISEHYTFDASNETVTILHDKSKRIERYTWTFDTSNKMFIGKEPITPIVYQRDTLVLVLPYKYGYTLGYFSRE